VRDCLIHFLVSLMIWGEEVTRLLNLQFYALAERICFVNGTVHISLPYVYFLLVKHHYYQFFSKL
jgi:hypothetical protein